MMVKQCVTCKEMKDITLFAKNRARLDGLQAECNPCKRVRYQQQMLDPEARKKETQRLQRYKQRTQTQARALIAAAKDVPCADCGRRYPSYVMDFDHVRGEKCAAVGTMAQVVWPGRIFALQEEIAKCEVVCSNCHRERTFQRKQAQKQTT